MEAPPKEGTLRRTKCGHFWYFDPPPSVDERIQLIEESLNRMLSTRILKRWIHLFRHVCDLLDEKAQLIKEVALAKLHALSAEIKSARLMRQLAAQAVPTRGWQDLEDKRGWQDREVNRGWQVWWDNRGWQGCENNHG